ncbi:MAG: hypothetical protein A3C58_01180 [Candidatus Staskawiczbacteria bacterium RIFCSPHIGHO2_02_FULL_34_10]|uniref:Stage V sporulation protein G n=1 Tax=Candidatus Staskawiczbacteria bacterium RIFCSPHIGHO2_02_FULL_34_10 TaxID=1802205 RepID=A0A1G2HXA7_9BACT|nr:MAG: hypothetical protein A3C58_01180 [Candidatus Staskawiczbacteria bacterium RIFCSPHIGHO2_02_FULL_34_10]
MTKITEIRIKLMEDSSERLKAFCSITFEGNFVVHDLKVIESNNGIIISMPSRKVMDKCPKCYSRNHLLARFCNQCGEKLKENRAICDTNGRPIIFSDLAHPITSHCRRTIEYYVLKAYYKEIEDSKQPDYISHYDDYRKDRVLTKAQ